MITEQIVVAGAAAATPPPESLWHYLQSLPVVIDGQIFTALFLAGLGGILWHYLCQWRNGYISGSLFVYLFDTNLRGTISSLMTLCAAIGAMSGFEGFYHDGSFLGWWRVLSEGFGMGLIADVTFNKGQREQWSEADRDYKRAHADDGK